MADNKKGAFKQSASRILKVGFPCLVQTISSSIASTLRDRMDSQQRLDRQCQPKRKTPLFRSDITITAGDEGVNALQYFFACL